ncbi:hypothetical protein OG594_27995 [Streptomyces sp. NBC_01214]|uniref:hypothetical protein n=1 Tax=Streptomyces sp. NBC_01214 TaxID=2903777 RepID=UPI00225B9CC2|nr:hypothetical protein [Streptomyces sp. NBC_01214]MCX4805409.1 hypothetical protein [Streptomyces sp. NBC_01214]
MTKSSPRAMKRMVSNVSKALAVGALSVAAIAVVTPAASAASSNSVFGCKGYWYNTSFHGYCGSVTQGGKFQLVAGCNYEANYMGKWRELSHGYSGKFDYDECTFKVNQSHVRYGG